MQDLTIKGMKTTFVCGCGCEFTESFKGNDDGREIECPVCGNKKYYEIESGFYEKTFSWDTKPL
jgi:hypothetical protein